MTHALLVRPLPPVPHAGRRSKAVRRFLVIATKKAKPVVPRYMVADDLPEMVQPVAYFTRRARLEWNDNEFREVRRAVSAFQAANRALATLDDESDEYLKAQVQYRHAWSECERVAFNVFNAKAETMRDLFLRAEMLTMHYGDDCLDELTQSEDPPERMLGALLAALWKVGGAANV